jgi:DNA (cytosine-5)-methyltransferase 1
MHYEVRKLGLHRGAPRLYIDSDVLRRCGLAPGQRFDVVEREGSLQINVAEDGARVVSRKARGGKEVPVLDINGRSLERFAGASSVRVVIGDRALHVLALASTLKAAERQTRLLERLASDQPLRVASLSFGAGVASHALHRGLEDAGVSSELALANEVEGEYLGLAIDNNDVITTRTITAVAPMQELVADDWLMARMPRVEVLEAGIPCSGASRAGAAKRALRMPEEHPEVGHLFVTALAIIARLQPAVVVIENVTTMATSATAAVMRSWLRDAGYTVSEVTLNARDFGSLENRVRWFMIAHPAALQVDFEALERRACDILLADVLEEVADDDARFRPVLHLVDKQDRDAAAGKGFAMQFLRPEDRSVPTLRKGYAKAGSTDPRLLHPTRPNLSRLLTAAAHARIKGAPERLVAGAGETLAHQVLGQAVNVPTVRAIGSLLGRALRQMRQALPFDPVYGAAVG